MDAEAISLLREVMNYRELGSQGPLKTKIREFLAKIDAAQKPRCGLDDHEWFKDKMADMDIYEYSRQPESDNEP